MTLEHLLNNHIFFGSLNDIPIPLLQVSIHCHLFVSKCHMQQSLLNAHSNSDSAFLTSFQITPNLQVGGPCFE